MSLYAKPSVIEGTWFRGNDKVVKLYYVISGRIEELASYTLQDDKKFGFAFNPAYEGFYVVGSGHSGAMTGKYIFYLKEGDSISFAVNDTTYNLTGNNTPENVLLEKWHSLILPAELKSVYFSKGMSTYVDFFPLLDEISGKAASFRASTPNKKFNAIFDKYKEYSLLKIAFNFLMTPRTAHPEKEDFSDFYLNIDYGKLLSSPTLLSFPFGAEVLQQAEYTIKRVSSPKTASYQGDFLNEIKDNALKGEYVVYLASKFKSYEGYKEFEQKYGQYVQTEDQKKRLKEMGLRLVSDSEKLQTYSFSYPNAEGKMVSLSDFKGKVVVVDLWATWCGPCKSQLPHLKKLEKEFHGKNVVFVAISTDKDADKQKWLDFIKKEELGGVQLHAGLNPEIMQFYGVKGIPRFLVYNKKGKIVSADAPRPSTPELKLLIEEELKK